MKTSLVLLSLYLKEHINDKPAWIQLMAYLRWGDKPLLEPI